MKVKLLYKIIQKFVDHQQFKLHIKTDAHNMDKIEEKLSFLEKDILKTEYPIVIAGKSIKYIYKYIFKYISFFLKNKTDFQRFRYFILFEQVIDVYIKKT